MSHLSGFASISSPTPYLSMQEDEATVRLHRISVAWFLLSLSISIYALWTIVHKLSPKRVPQTRVGLCMVVLGTMSNGLQLLYQLFPEGDSLTTPLWTFIDALDYLLYAATVCCYAQISWRRSQFKHDRMPKCIITLIDRVYLSKHLLVLYQVLMVLCLGICFVSIHAGWSDLITHESGVWDKVRVWYLLVSQLVAIAIQLLFAFVYLFTWPMFSDVTYRQNTRPDLRSIFVVLVILSTIALQLLLLLDWFLNMYIWLGSRLLWMAYTTLLIGLTSIFLLQLQLIQQAMTDVGSASHYSSSHSLYSCKRKLLPKVALPAVSAPDNNVAAPDVLSSCSYNPASNTTQLASLGNRDIFPFDLYVLHHWNPNHQHDSPPLPKNPVGPVSDSAYTSFIHQGYIATPGMDIDCTSISTFKLSAGTRSCTSVSAPSLPDPRDRPVRLSGVS